MKTGIGALWLLIVVLTTTALTGCGAESLAQSQLKIGSLPRIFDLIAYAAQEDGIFKKYNLEVEIVSFRSTVEMNNALLAGDIDGIIQGTFEAVNLNKDQVNAKLVGHNYMTRMFEVTVSSGSNISNPSQLKGREIATGTGTIMEYAMDELLRTQGLSGKDVTCVNVPNIALRVEMLNQGKVPAAVLTCPISDLAVASGNKIILDDSQQPLGGPGLIFSVKALNGKSDGIKRFVQSWQESVAAINANPQKYHRLLMDVAKVPETVAAGVSVPVFSELRLPTEAELKSIMDWMIAKGLMNKPLSYNEIVSAGYLK